MGSPSTSAGKRLAGELAWRSADDDDAPAAVLQSSRMTSSSEDGRGNRDRPRWSPRQPAGLARADFIRKAGGARVSGHPDLDGRIAQRPQTCRAEDGPDGRLHFFVASLRRSAVSFFRCSLS